MFERVFKPKEKAQQSEQKWILTLLFCPFEDLFENNSNFFFQCELWLLFNLNTNPNNFLQYSYWTLSELTSGLTIQNESSSEWIFWIKSKSAEREALFGSKTKKCTITLGSQNIMKIWSHEDHKKHGIKLNIRCLMDGFFSMSFCVFSSRKTPQVVLVFCNLWWFSLVIQ